MFPDLGRDPKDPLVLKERDRSVKAHLDPSCVSPGTASSSCSCCFLQVSALVGACQARFPMGPQSAYFGPAKLKHVTLINPHRRPLFFLCSSCCCSRQWCTRQPPKRHHSQTGQPKLTSARRTEEHQSTLACRRAAGADPSACLQSLKSQELARRSLNVWQETGTEEIWLPFHLCPGTLVWEREVSVGGGV